MVDVRGRPQEADAPSVLNSHLERREVEDYWEGTDEPAVVNILSLVGTEEKQLELRIRALSEQGRLSEDESE